MQNRMWFAASVVGLNHPPTVNGVMLTPVLFDHRYCELADANDRPPCSRVDGRINTYATVYETPVAFQTWFPAVVLLFTPVLCVMKMPNLLGITPPNNCATENGPRS